MRIILLVFLWLVASAFVLHAEAAAAQVLHNETTKWQVRVAGISYQGPIINPGGSFPIPEIPGVQSVWVETVVFDAMTIYTIFRPLERVCTNGWTGVIGPSPMGPGLVITVRQRADGSPYCLITGN